MTRCKAIGVAGLGLLCAACQCTQMKGSTAWAGVLSYSLMTSDGGAPIIASDATTVVAATYQPEYKDDFLCPAGFAFTIGPSCVLRATSGPLINAGSIDGSQTCTLSEVTFPVTGGSYSVDTYADTMTLTLAAVGADVHFQGSKT